jgi:hypothetical protein
MRGQPSLWHMSFHIAGDRGKMPIARVEYGSGEVANVSGVLCKLSPSATCEARTVVALTTSRKCWSSLDMFAMIRGSSRRYSVSLAKECGDSLVGCDRPRLTYVSHRDGRCANARDLRERHHLQASRILPHNRGNARLLTLQVDRPLLAHTIAIYRPGRVKAWCNVIFSISAFHLYHQATLSDA